MPAPTAFALLIALLKQEPGLRPDEVTDFAQCWKQTIHLRRGDFLVQPGQIEQRLCLVRRGLLRTYFQRLKNRSNASR